MIEYEGVGDLWQAQRFTRKDGKMLSTLRNTRPYKGDITIRIAFCFPFASQTTPQVCRKSTGQSLDRYCEWQPHFVSPPVYPTKRSLGECCDKDDHAVHQRKFKGTLCSAFLWATPLSWITISDLWHFVRCNAGADYVQNPSHPHSVVCWQPVCWSKHVCNAVFLPSHWGYIEQTRVMEGRRGWDRDTIHSVTRHCCINGILIRLKKKSYIMLIMMTAVFLHF